MKYLTVTFFAGVIAVLILACCQPKQKPDSISDPTTIKIHQIVCPSGQTIEYVRESPMSITAERKLCDMLEPAPKL